MGPTNASIFRVEGVLVRRTAAHCAAWLATGGSSWWGRFAGVGLGALTAPLAARGEARALHDVAWRPLDGWSEDRLLELGDHYWTDVVERSWNGAGLRLFERCAERGDHLVLVSDHPHAAIGPLLDHLGADRLVCNRLARSGHRLTGRLAEPVVSGRIDGTWIRELAGSLDISPTEVCAYGAAAADATLLSGAGRPCAVTPAPALRRLADELGWPVVEA